MFATSSPFRGLLLHRHPRRVVSPSLLNSRRRHRRRRCAIRQPTVFANRYQTSVEVPTTKTPIASNNALFWVVLVAQVHASSIATHMEENLAQSVALVGATVGGFLARRRRRELETLTDKLRNVNAELRRQREEDLHVCEADGDIEAMRSYRAALEVALEAPSEQHPLEDHGTSESTLAGARREFSRSLQDSRESLRIGDTSEAYYLCNNAIALSKEMRDLRAERSATKLKAQIYKAMDEPLKALKNLKVSLALSGDLEDHSGDVDTLGDIGDIYTEIGDYERAGKFYDLCCKVIREEEYSENLSPYWDC